MAGPFTAIVLKNMETGKLLVLLPKNKDEMTKAEFVRLFSTAVDSEILRDHVLVKDPDHDGRQIWWRIREGTEPK